MKKLFCLTLVISLLSALVPASRAQSNTLVRFRVSYGSTVLGNIDVELFDQDKPVTVSNFLAYVDSGRYKRTFFHRVVPGFVIQGGSGTIVNPYSGALFQIVNAITTDPPITNEFNVGSYRSNLFGTLAMAKVGTNESCNAVCGANSATSSFFFNLGNNSTNLDSQNGGFTVFGRAIAGTNLFGTFNSLSYYRGIMDWSSSSIFCGIFMYVYKNGAYSQFTDGTSLPVSFIGNYCVRYLDALVVDVFRLNGPGTDTAAPTVTILSPAANANMDAPDVTVSGTASDLVGVSSVDVILNHERLTIAAGGANWSTTITNVHSGTNTLTVVAIDANGNQSKPVFRNFFRRQQQTLTLTNTGLGTVTGLTNMQVVDLNRNYKLLATPATGYLFKHWRGGFAFGGGTRMVIDPNLICYFYPETNAWLEAVFVPNPFIPTKGNYNGLFSESNTVRMGRAGYFAMALTDRGSYSGKLSIEGKTVPFKGLFGLEGTSTTTITRNGSNDLFLRLNLVLTNGTSQVTGTVSRLSESWYASLTADQSFYNIKTNPAPRAGQYTMVLPGTAGTSNVPQGDGYGTVKIDGNGKVIVAGALADGSKFTQTTVLSKNDTWPFFGSLYKGKGLALGWLDIVTGNPSTDILGDVAWLKTAAAGGTLYTNGFLKITNVVGSRFIKPLTATNRVVEIPTGTIAFSGGSLNPEFNNPVNIAPNSVVTTPNPNKLTLTFNKATGLMNGTVAHPNGTPTLKFSGVVLQQHQIGGYGFFLNTNASGRVLLSP